MSSTRTTTIHWPSVILMALRNPLTRDRQKLANRLGVSRSTIQNYSTGATAEPPYSIGVELLKLSKTEGEK